MVAPKILGVNDTEIEAFKLLVLRRARAHGLGFQVEREGACRIRYLLISLKRPTSMCSLLALLLSTGLLAKHANSDCQACASAYDPIVNLTRHGTLCRAGTAPPCSALDHAIPSEAHDSWPSSQAIQRCRTFETRVGARASHPAAPTSFTCRFAEQGTW